MKISTRQYLRPKISYDFSDNLTLETGANIFVGSEPYTFFGQFENNSNIYPDLYLDRQNWNAGQD